MPWETAESLDSRAITIMKFINIDKNNIHRIYSLDTNNIPAKNDNAALEKARKAAIFLNSAEKPENNSIYK